MKVLFLHGANQEADKAKSGYLARHGGHEVIAPELTNQDFDQDLKLAQAEFDRTRPDLIVGSARGGALAMNLNSGETRMVLICPEWKRWGTSLTIKQGTVILHSDSDEEIDLKESQELVKNSGLNEAALIETGYDHEMDDHNALSWLIEVCWDDRYHAIHEASHALTGIKLRLTPKQVAIGRTSMGTSGGTEFCSMRAVRRDSDRFLKIAVAGCVGTRIAGYGNQLVSEELIHSSGAEPGWMSDAMRVWEKNFPLSEIESAESEVHRILERNRPAVEAIAGALIEKGVLGKDEIRDLIAGSRKRL